VNDGGSNGAGCFEIKIWTDASKLTKLHPHRGCTGSVHHILQHSSCIHLLPSSAGRADSTASQKLSVSLSVCALNEHDYYHHDFFVTDFQLLWAFSGHPWTPLGAPVPHTLVLPLPISTDATGRQRDINSHKTIEVFPVYCKETERRWHVKWVSVQCSVTAAAAAAAAAAAQCRMQLLGARRDADAHARKRYSAIASILTWTTWFVSVRLTQTTTQRPTPDRHTTHDDSLARTNDRKT